MGISAANAKTGGDTTAEQSSVNTEPVDTDGDGIPDEFDRCVEEAGPALNDGCPELVDTDGDGVYDSEDQCVNEAGPASNNGCPLPPPPADSDNDGVPDKDDAFPNDPNESKDSDGDGVGDNADQCVNEAGPASNNGCPEEDNGGNNPPGNNGTVKIDGVDFDSHPNNEPHVGCQFQVDFYGFDEGVGDATVTFEPQAPTANVQIEVTSGDLTPDIGEDAAGGGTDLDASETYTLKFTGAPHPQQGYHVKLTVNAPGSQGNDTKHKVFWVEDCEQTEPPKDKEVTPAAPTHVDKCETEHDTYTIPETKGVFYKVDGTKADAGTYPGSGTVKVTAHAKEGYVLKGDSEWTFTFTNEPCDNPPPPTPVINPSGSVTVDCYGNGTAVFDNTKSTTAFGFELVKNGEATLYSVPAGEKKTISFSGAKPGSKVIVQDGEANELDSATVPLSCGDTPPPPPVEEDKPTASIASGCIVYEGNFKDGAYANILFTNPTDKPDTFVVEWKIDGVPQAERVEVKANGKVDDYQLTFMPEDGTWVELRVLSLDGKTVFASEKINLAQCSTPVTPPKPQPPVKPTTPEPPVKPQPPVKPTKPVTPVTPVTSCPAGYTMASEGWCYNNPTYADTGVGNDQNGRPIGMLFGAVLAGLGGAFVLRGVRRRGQES